MNFTGNVTDQTCTVVAGSANQTIPMGNISAKAFKSAGDTALPTKFSIALTSCPETVTKASVKFDGTYAQGNSTLLSLNSESGVATGLGVALYEADGNHAKFLWLRFLMRRACRKTSTTSLPMSPNIWRHRIRSQSGRLMPRHNLAFHITDKNSLSGQQI
ncbi:fimbrial protein [Serratia marcescens]|uniref:fimbrial protein n=1 Tax=Serratia marcescens TaxID=615 RepID=UPI0009A62AA3